MSAERLVVVTVPEELVRELLSRWPELRAHPRALGLARRYSASQAVRAAARVGLANLPAE